MKVIIIGNHPLAESLVCQYETLCYIVDRRPELTADGVNINDYDELSLLSGDGEDDKAMALLVQLASRFDVQTHQGRRLVCHLLLHSNQTLQMLHTTDFCEAVRQKTDVYPFTLDEVWSRSIILDYEPITRQSEKHIHLVIFGMDEMAQMVVIQAALVAHYPSYVNNHAQRTRITMVDKHAEQKSATFVKNYQHLFDNSYYRIVKPLEEKAVTLFHKPMYAETREDFVDVEWEFVEAENWNADLREKLQLWAKDTSQLLTVVLTYKDENKNLSEALRLPQELYAQHIPIYIYCPQEVSLPDCSHIHCFGMNDKGYDVTLPLVRMAKNVNYIYDRCYEDNEIDWSGKLRYTVEINPEEKERSWARLSSVKRMSSIYNAMTIPTKMRSIGLEEQDWDKFYDIPQNDIELLSQVEHNRWTVEELILGYRPCTDEELELIAADVNTQKNVYKARKIHYDLRAYDELRPDGTGKPVQIYDQCLCSCLPLIVKETSMEKGGKA